VRFSIQIQITWLYRTGARAPTPQGDPPAGSSAGWAAAGGAAGDVVAGGTAGGVVVTVDGGETAPEAAVRP
jgi:hypothetical protein